VLRKWFVQRKSVLLMEKLYYSLFPSWLYSLHISLTWSLLYIFQIHNLNFFYPISLDVNCRCKSRISLQWLELFLFCFINLQEPCVLYIGRPRSATIQMLHFIYFFNKYKYSVL
jgi:hypothetical protein